MTFISRNGTWVIVWVVTSISHLFQGPIFLLESTTDKLCNYADLHIWHTFFWKWTVSLPLQGNKWQDLWPMLKRELSKTGSRILGRSCLPTLRMVILQFFGSFLMMSMVILNDCNFLILYNKMWHLENVHHLVNRYFLNHQYMMSPYYT